MSDNQTKTYVLVGHDHNNAFAGLASAFEWRGNLKGDVVLLEASRYPTMDALKEAITPPARIVIAAHGYKDSAFEWAEGQKVSYDTLFKQLPRDGVELVTIAGCYGGTAAENMAHLPAGTVLQSLVGEAVPGWSGALSRFAEEVVGQRGPLTSLSFILKGLDNTDPRDSVAAAATHRRENKASPDATHTYAAHDVLPYSYAIGGMPPIHLDLDIEVSNLRGRPHAGPEAKASFDKAVALVFANIDSFSAEGSTARDIDAVQRQIRTTAANIAEGKPIGVEEKRIAYAIAIANLHVSGEMGRMVEMQQESRDANPDAKTRIRAQWDGKGSETVAKLQAIIEATGFSTDNGGARDGRVSGQMTPQTKEIAGLLQRASGLPAGISHEAMLEAIRKDPGMMKDFAIIKGEDGQSRLDVILSVPRQGSDRGSPTR